MRVNLFNRMRIEAVVPYFWFALFVLSIKLVIIAHYGNATPFWDQWDAEADNLYRPWLDGSITLQHWFAAHNEHRIFTTRLLALALLKLNGGIWNPILQMQVNATLHVAALSILLFYLSKGLLSSYKISLFVFSAVLFSIPFGWENTLAGFQSQFYFLLLFSFSFLWAMSAYKTYSLKWWLGVVAGTLSLVTLASGALAVLAGGLILAARRWLAKDKTDISISAIVLIMSMVVLSIILTPTIQGHAVLKAQSANQFLFSLAGIMSWPDHKIGIGVLVIQVPLLLLGLRILRNGEYHTPLFLFIAAMTLWLFGQFVTIAYGRAVGSNSSRYLDIFAIGLVLNFTALLYLLEKSNTENVYRYKLGMAAWIATIVFGFSMSADALLETLRTKAHQGQEQETNVRAYLCSGEFTNLQNKPNQFIPYPNPERLKIILDNPTVRSILPANIYGPNSRHQIGADGEPFCDPGSLTWPFKMIDWNKNETAVKFAVLDTLKNSGWHGTDYFKSVLPGFSVIGSFVNSENDTGIISLHLKRGDQILFRSGPRVGGQFLLINEGGEGKFYTQLPLAIDQWNVLVFSNESLPSEFDVSFIDAGTKWGEWSAIALKSYGIH